MISQWTTSPIYLPSQRHSAHNKILENTWDILMEQSEKVPQDIYHSVKNALWGVDIDYILLWWLKYSINESIQNPWRNDQDLRAVIGQIVSHSFCSNVFESVIKKWNIFWIPLESAHSGSLKKYESVYQIMKMDSIRRMRWFETAQTSDTTIDYVYKWVQASQFAAEQIAQSLLVEPTSRFTANPATAISYALQGHSKWPMPFVLQIKKSLLVFENQEDNEDNCISTPLPFEAVEKIYYYINS